MRKKFIFMMQTFILFKAFIIGPMFNHVYLDNKNNFKIKYPQSWSIKGTPRPRKLIKADLLSKDKKTGIQIRIYKRNNNNIKNFTQWYKKNFIKEMGSPVLLEEKYHTIAGNDSSSLSFDGTKRNGYFLKSYLILFRDSIYTFQCGTPFFQRSTQEPVIDSIVYSFETL